MSWTEIECGEYIKLHKELSPLTSDDQGKTIVYKKDDKPVIKVTCLTNKYSKYWRKE